MKKTGILNRDVSALVAETGHYDRIVIGDAGLPIPPGVPCIDLTVGKNDPTIEDVLKMLALELPVEQFWIATEYPSVDSRIKQIQDIFPGSKAITVAHDEFKKLNHDAMCVIRTGDFSPYSNVMLACGVAFN